MHPNGFRARLRNVKLAGGGSNREATTYAVVGIEEHARLQNISGRT
jgi:hypothetical protein